jgi:hypothetical protein
VAVEHGYDAERRSVVWSLGEAVVKVGGDGPYRALYLERKALEHSRDPEMSKAHAHARAKRYMEKRLLRELWREWWKATTDSCPAPLHDVSSPAVTASALKAATPA